MPGDLVTDLKSSRNQPHHHHHRRRFVFGISLLISLVLFWTLTRAREGGRGRAWRDTVDALQHRHHRYVNASDRQRVPPLTSRLRQIRGQTRLTGIGARLQRTCGETEGTPEFSTWLDALHDLGGSGESSAAAVDSSDGHPSGPSVMMTKSQARCLALLGSDEVERWEHSERIFRSAERQCGSWCLWDVTTDDKAGWHLLNGCFRPFRSPHFCDQFWWQKGQKSMQ